MKFLFLLLPIFSFAQEIPKGTNQITVKGISFQQAVTTLLDNGYTIEKSDSVYKTLKTDFRNCPLKNGKQSTVNISISVRIKDSAALITSKWYSDIGLSRGLLIPSRSPGPMDIYQVEYSWGANKLLFLRMNQYADSLRGEKSFSVVKK